MVRLWICSPKISVVVRCLWQIVDPNKVEFHSPVVRAKNDFKSCDQESHFMYQQFPLNGY